jgi:hypothetical protein
MSDVLRVISFIVVTIAQIFLAFFLLFFGSETLKFFAIFLLSAELFVLLRLYFQFTKMRT